MEEQLSSGIYKWTNPTGRIYIGQAEDLKERRENYKYLSNVKGQRRLYNSFKKHGIENHVFEIWERCSKEDLNRRERYWQDYYNVLSPMGMNCVLQDADEKRRIYSKETKRRMSEAQKIIKNTPEAKRKTSEKHKGKIITDEHKKVLSEKFTLRWTNPEFREKLIAKQKLFRPSEELKLKRRLAIRKIYELYNVPILQFDKKMNFIKEWKTIEEAGNSLGITLIYILYCCQNKKKYKSASGYKWKFK